MKKKNENEGEKTMKKNSAIEEVLFYSTRSGNLAVSVDDGETVINHLGKRMKRTEAFEEVEADVVEISAECQAKLDETLEELSKKEAYFEERRMEEERRRARREERIERARFEREERVRRYHESGQYERDCEFMFRLCEKLLRTIQ